MNLQRTLRGNVTVELPDAVARAIYEARNGHGCKSWSLLPKTHKEPYLGDASAAIAAMPSWQPIETAPDSETERVRVLLWVANGAISGKGNIKGSVSFGSCYHRPDGTVQCLAEGFYGAGWDITMWHPLPAAPEVRS